ncbi:MAG: PEP-CTERM sorting domain-containing protein [Rhodanobacter sp.]|nr:MAG: PEP-CTERM sorting domain-containing protein [Rhodanobacter sp.]
MKRFLALSGLTLAVILPMSALAAIDTGEDGGGTLAPTSTTININLDKVFTGSIPDGMGPWLKATFTSDMGASSGTLTLTSYLSNPDFVQGLNSNRSAIGWAFYLNRTVTGINCTSGTCADNNAFSETGGFNSGPVPGVFNLAFGWSSGNRLQSGSSAVYDLTFSSALNGNSLAVNPNEWLSVAHVQGILGGCSGWIVSGTGTTQGGSPCITPRQTVPEPAAMGIFGLGLLLMGLFVGLRRRYD